MTTIRVFIASPGDVGQERDVVSLVIAEINRTFGNPFGVQLEPVRWETHAWPDVGADAQDVINNQIGEFDILVGVMWRRFGSPTRRAKSGTGEEFERAYQLFKKHGRPRIMFYFRTTPFYTTDLAEISQFRKVAEFRHKLEGLGVLYWTYEKPLDFERNVREHLVRQILALAEPESGRGKPTREALQREPRVGAPEAGPSVFLAYSHRDRDTVRSLYGSLRAAGYATWLDEEDLVPGQMWHSEVDEAIRKTDVILLIVSSQSDLDRGFLAKEIQLATRQRNVGAGPILIPVRLDQVELPPMLREIQWVDYFVPDGMERLVEAIDRAWKARQQRKG